MVFLSLDGAGIANAQESKAKPMNKIHRCLLHCRCIARKRLRSQDWEWHRQHLLREIGFGIYSQPAREPSSHH